MHDAPSPAPSETSVTDAPESVHLLVSNERPILDTAGGARRAVAGVDASAACRALAALGDADVGATIRESRTAELATWLAEHGVSEIVLYARGASRIVPLEVGPDPSTRCPLVMVVDAGSRPDRDAEAGNTLLELRRERVASGDMAPLALDSWITTDQDLYAPCHPEMLKRDFWPRFERSDGASGEKLATFEFYTNIEAAAHRAGAGGRVVAVGGREALRWVHAAPVGLDSIIIDPNSPSSISLSARRVRSVLFPATFGFDGIDTLPEFDVSELTSFVPIDADTAIVTGTLLNGWRSMLGPTGAPPDASPPVGFTGQDAFVESMQSGRQSLANPVSPSEQPPFRDWLAHASNAGSIVIDPQRPAPLELDLVRLFLLACWAEEGSGLTGASFARALARETSAGHLDAHWTGRVAAQWPDWTLGELIDRSAGVDDTRPWIATEDGRLALFVDEPGLSRFIAAERPKGRLRAQWRARPRRQSLDGNLFELAAREYSGCVIDPGGAQVVLDGEGLASADAALRDLLQPRHMRY